MGAHLVDIDSLEENVFLSNLASRHDFWTGLHDLKDEHNFRRSDGSEPKFFNWQIGMPNGANAKGNCVVVDWTSNYYNRRWSDTACWLEYQFICEKPKGK